MLVDDDSGNALLSQIILERLGFSVHMCESGLQAEVDFRSAPGDYLFVATDYSMAPINGFQLAERLLAIDPHAPILVMTGYDHPELFRQAERLGVYIASPKPTTADEFSDLIQRMRV